MAKIIPISDIHAEFLHWRSPERRKIPACNGEILICAGDIETKGNGPYFLRYAYPNHRIVYTPGNHEYYGSSIESMDDLLRKECEKYDIHFLQCDSITIEGIQISGCTLWTNFELFGAKTVDRSRIEAERYMRDYLAIYYENKEEGSVNTDHTIQIHNKHLAWLKQQQSDIIVTHHPPSFQGIQDCYKDSLLSAAFASNLDHVVQQSGAKYWFCGHSHVAKRFKIGQTEVVINSMGYPGEKIEGFDPALVLEI